MTKPTLIHFNKNIERICQTQLRVNIFFLYFCYNNHNSVNQFNIIPFSGKVWFHHTKNVQSHNRFPVLIHELPFHDTFGLWCAMSETRITGPTFFLWDHKITPVCNTFLYQLLNTCQIRKNIWLFPAKKSNSSCQKLFYTLFTKHFWWQNINHNCGLFVLLIRICVIFTCGTC